jgi:hypothetical protein
MTRLSGSDWRKGVTYRWSGKLPLGSYSVVISARSTHKGSASTGAGTVKISPPKPKATPEPTATPKPTPKPTARPTVKPRRTAPPIVGSLVAPTATPTATPDATATSNALPLIAMIALTSGPTGPGGPTGPTGPILPASNSTLGPRSGPGQPSHGSGGPLASLLAFAGLHDGTFTGFPLAPTLVTTTGVVAMGMAFGLFGRKRREDEGDDVLSAAAASGVGFMQHDGAVGIAAAAGAVLDVDDTEALMPRWRRPSLIQARKADPIRDMAPAPRLTFDQGLVGPLDDGRERKVVRYRVVRLLDSPDELRGQEIGYLDQGDEVQLLEKYGAYWLVVSPDGQQGWLHKMTLGDAYEEDAPPPEGPVATMPIAAETWTMGEADIDGDVFDAYLESRRRRGA